MCVCGVFFLSNSVQSKGFEYFISFMHNCELHKNVNRCVRFFVQKKIMNSSNERIETKNDFDLIFDISLQFEINHID